MNGLYRYRNLLLLLATGGIIALYSQILPNSVGTVGPAPNIAVKTDTGNVSLADYKGKVVLIDFWATWCGPCIDALPNVQKMYAKYKDDGFVVLGVAIGSDPSQMKQLAKSAGLKYAYGQPVDKAIVDQYKIENIPLSVLVDRQGNISLRQEGMNEEALSAQIEKLLKAP